MCGGANEIKTKFKVAKEFENMTVPRHMVLNSVFIDFDGLLRRGIKFGC